MHLEDIWDGYHGYIDVIVRVNYNGSSECHTNWTHINRQCERYVSELLKIFMMLVSGVSRSYQDYFYPVQILILLCELSLDLNHSPYNNSRWNPKYQPLWYVWKLH